MRLRRLAPVLVFVVGCSKDKAVTTPPPAPAPAGIEVLADDVAPHVETLASDAYGGRAPGTDGDAKTQAYVEQALVKAGLKGAFGGEFLQPFEVGDGVSVNGATVLRVGDTPLPHAVVPFSGRAWTGIESKLVYVGYGIEPDGPGSGDYAKLAKKVKDKIVVARAGSADPHVQPALVRPQQKLINARDHGAIGFIYWEPEVEAPYPNHGEANDLKIPALWVGKEGTPVLLEALHAKDVDSLAPGKTSKKKATMEVPIEPIVKQTANVVGVLPGNGSSPKKLVIGAHMDHLGMGTSTSLAPGEHAVHNGADDNASGVAVMIELARELAKTDETKRPYDIVFIAFGAEEMGLLGSKHYVDSLGADAASTIVAMLNFDMVGRLGDDGLQVSGVGTSSVWPDLVEGARGELTVTTTDDGYGPSDHGSFYEAGVPVLHFFTGSHADYHKPSDDTDKINFDGAAKVANMALAIAEKIENETLAPDYIKVARKEQARGGFRVSLGTIPDYGAKVDGVRLTGVRDGGPAAAAGIAKGDVIQKLADREIHNLDDYMAAFAVLEPGVEVEVVVQRDGKPVTLKMTPAAPQRRQ